MTIKKQENYEYLFSEKTKEEIEELREINHAILNLEKFQKGIERKMYFPAEKEIKNFERRMKKAGYDYSKEVQDMKKTLYTKIMLKEQNRALRYKDLGERENIKIHLENFKIYAKKIGLDVSSKVKEMREECSKNYSKNLLDIIGKTLLQDEIDISEIKYLISSIPLLEKEAKGDRKEFILKQAMWAKKTLNEKAAETYTQRGILSEKENSFYFDLAYKHAKEVGDEAVKKVTLAKEKLKR